MGDKTKISWSEATWNAVTGCDKISPGCANCLGGDTLILMADMSWTPLKDVSVGDEVVSFLDHPKLGQNRTYEKAVVEHKWTTFADAVEITVGERVLIASHDHLFLAPWRPYWRPAEALNLSTPIVDIGFPEWLPNINSCEFAAGYIAGASGGDGTMRIAGSGKNGTKQSYFRVANDADDRPLLERLQKNLLSMGCVNINIRPFDGGSGEGIVKRDSVRKPMLKVETRRMGNLVMIAEKCLPEQSNSNWKAGFLSGFFDTDGSYSGKNLRFHQTKPNDHLTNIQRYISDLGFESVLEDFSSANAKSVRLVGNLQEKIRFLSTIQPALTRKAADFYGRRFPGKTGTLVDGVRRVGIHELIDIQTSSGTFVAAGLATHNCYAQTLAQKFRFQGVAGYQKDGDPRTSGPGFGVTLHYDKLDIPLRWKRPRLIFTNSMSDMWHKEIPDDFIVHMFAIMAATPRHTYQVLTKRSQRMQKFMSDDGLAGRVYEKMDQIIDYEDHPLVYPAWPLPNVWLGVSVETQRYADLRIPHLLDTPAAVRFLSCEPLLGPIDLLQYLGYTPTYVAKRKRKNSLQLGPERLSGDSSGRVYLESGLPKTEPMEYAQEILSDFSTEESGHPSAGWVPRGKNNGEPEADGNSSPPSGVSPLLGSNSRRADNKSHQWNQGRQSSNQSRTGDLLGTGDSSSDRFGSHPRSMGREEQYVQIDGRTDRGNSAPSSDRRTTKNNSGRLWDQIPSGIQDRTRRPLGVFWVLIGGESGGGFRPMEVEWAESLVNQCKGAEVSCFVKQDSGRYPGKQGRLSDEVWKIKEFPS